MKIPAKYILKTGLRAVRYLAGPGTFSRLYAKYFENWGTSAPVYRFQAVKDGKVVAEISKSSNAKLSIRADVSASTLTEGDTYDAAAIRVRIADENGSTAPYAQLPVHFEVSGPVELIGPDTVCSDGGMCGTYVRTTGRTGAATLRITAPQTQPVELTFQVKAASADRD